MRFSEFNCATTGAEEFAVSPKNLGKQQQTAEACQGAAIRTSRIRGGRPASRILESDRFLKEAAQKLLL
jgi:hypothetical protein